MKSNLIDFLEEAAKVLPPEGTPEYEAALKKLANYIPKVQFDEAYKNVRAGRAGNDTPEGYKAFYELVHGFPPPSHVVREINTIFGAHEEGVGTVVFAWRGSWKSVSISVTFLAWRIGLEPAKTNVVVCANDDSAEKIAKAIASIIEYHPEWKRVFQNVIPDAGRWSVEGFSVIDTSMDREAWAKQQSGVIDPTLIGGGYKSSRLIGKHPSGVLCIDDIHDRDNSASERERKAVVDILTKTILKTVVKEKDKMTTWLIAVGTPWASDDAYYTLKNTGQYEFISIPAMKRTEEGQGVYIDGVNRDGVVFDDIVGWWELEFPDHFGPKTVIKERADGKAVFWQMIMLDLTTAETGRLRYYGYPAEDISLDWYTVAGLDPTYSDEQAENKNSYMALAFVSRLPTGGAVVADGILEQCSLLQTENHILLAQGKYPNLAFTAVENVGGGKVVLQALRANPKVRVIPSGLKDFSDARVSSKRDRIRKIHRWFENGTVRISEADTPFLNALRRLFDKFADLDEKHSMEFDAGDAVFHALNNMPEVLVVPYSDEFPSPVRRRQESPFAGLGDYTWRK